MSAFPAQPTKTLNPLPFHDLEPHRFEDLVRQLAYDLRRWKSLEASGRGGADDGIDIRAVEIARLDDDSDEGNDEEPPEPAIEERLWVFQCKREKSLSPKRIQKVVKESLVSLSKPPHGFVLAAACDVSKKARDAFREEMVSRGVEEFSIWAKGELEDMLFQPKNDRLLFAYFGLSLQPRRRSLATALRALIARKKQLKSLLGEENGHGKLVLLRDPNDERYPPDPRGAGDQGKWMTCYAISIRKPGHLIVLRHEHLAAMTPDHKKWDALVETDLAETMADNELRSAQAWRQDRHRPDRQTAHDFWNEYIPEEDRARLKVFRAVPIDRILAVDLLGDGFFPIPHIMIEFDDKKGPFSEWESVRLERPRSHFTHIDLKVSAENRAQIFPKPLPGLDEPTPKGFDQTGKAEPLSRTASTTLTTIISAAAQSRNKHVRPAAPAKDYTKEARATMAPFLAWRKKVASPVFSAFVEELRKAGHGAWVSMRSAEASSHGGEASESIELRVRMNVGSAHNPSFHVSGAVRVVMRQYGGWGMDISPTAEASRDQYRPTPVPAPKLEEMPKEQLEGHVLAMLERLKPLGA